VVAGLGVPAVRAELVDTAEDAADCFVIGDEALSVTCSSKV
jgi:hypothetical protein